MNDLFSLQGKVALVTGAGRGIGRTLALGLADAGADIVAVSRTSTDLDSLVKEIQAKGRRALGLTADVTNQEQVTQMTTAAFAEMGRIDVLINNAGMNIRKKALDLSEEEWDTVVNTDMKSVFLVSQAVGRRMCEQGSGSVVNIASVAAHVALRTGVAYGASKAAVVQMTRILAMEWAKSGVRVNSIGPWYFKTPLTEKLLQDPTYLGEILAVTPMGRVGQVEELVGPTLFLASSASSYVTGQTLYVDGGMTIFGF